MNIPKSEILKAVNQYYQIDNDKYLFEKVKHDGRVLKRQICTYLLLTDSEGTFMDCEKFIEKATGTKYHHATLMYSRDRINVQKGIYPDVAADIENIRNLYPKPEYQHIKFQNTTGSKVNYITN